MQLLMLMCGSDVRMNTLMGNYKAAIQARINKRIWPHISTHVHTGGNKEIDMDKKNIQNHW